MHYLSQRKTQTTKGRDITPDFQRLKMKSLIIIFLLATCLFHTSRCVLVTESGHSFTLEAVKTLKKLMESDMSTNPLYTYCESASLCTNPKLPREFTVVCEKDDAGIIFQNLVKIITPIDPCEICANVACTGCL